KVPDSEPLIQANRGQEWAEELDIEDSPGVVAEEKAGQFHRLGFRRQARADEVVGEDLGEDTAIHIELGQHEFELVSIAVIADLLDLRNRLKPSPKVLLDVGRDVGIPPMAVGDDVGENPAVAGQLLVLAATQDGDAKSHYGNSVEKRGVLNQGSPLVEQILPLMNAVLIDSAVDADHQVERQLEIAAALRQHP